MTGFSDSQWLPNLEDSSSSSALFPDVVDQAEFPQTLGSSDSFFFFDSLLDNNIEDSSPTLPFGIKENSQNGKVPIPRTSTPTEWSDRCRVSQACKPCHGLKTKCSGHRPTCRRCEEMQLDCNYGDRKRERTARRIEDLNAHIDKLETTLRDLYPSLGTQSASQVDQALRRTPNHEVLQTFPDLAELHDEHGDRLVALDHADEDFNRDRKLQELGFMGEHSEVAWLYRLKSTLAQDVTTFPIPEEESSGLAITSMNYYSTDGDVEIRHDVGILERPDKSVADKLIHTYFQAIHPSFPLLGKTTFLAQYQVFYADPAVRPGRQWLAVLNLIFATAAVHLSGLQVEGDPGNYSHLDYFSRAWRLSIGKTSLQEDPNLQQVQIELTTRLTKNLGSRSWRFCGLAIRSALAMALNLRLDSQRVAPLSKEVRYRLWWTLYTLDTSLSAITGRPPGIGGTYSTTPLPIPFEEGNLNSSHVLKCIEDRTARKSLIKRLLRSKGDGGTTHQSMDRDGSRSTKRPLDETNPPIVAEAPPPPPSDSLCFFYTTSLSIIMREALDSIYAPCAAYKSWANIDTMISTLNKKADTWLDSLPRPYHFQTPSELGPLKRQRLKLAFQFYSTKIFITRPCLRRFMASLSKAPDDTDASSGSMRLICIEATCHLLDLLPDEPDLAWLHVHCARWSVLHHLMQAITVVLTDSFICTKMGTTSTRLVPPIFQKARAWLKEMSRVDLSAHNAWTLSSDLRHIIPWHII
ncbi:uncharacterized protein N7515_005707 [Penicillium bovifimosum]|uniref:Zn(2)-C6 fungal-type domain-containing protein n=1 Tax=Penicillium bovifimosum TaxID=126998 RepID=A0A9W9GTP0_9EURO|nr:uncharacterized protein N7515_005707 [Penicillium bovifimosum]KAJ5129668.1 hypothetical protein N7515_005707 [Penicillium bovifimosum]